MSTQTRKLSLVQNEMPAVVGLTSPEFQAFIQKMVRAFIRRTKVRLSGYANSIARSWTKLNEKYAHAGEMDNRVRELSDRYITEHTMSGRLL